MTDKPTPKPKPPSATFRMALPLPEIKAVADSSPMISERGLRQTVADFMEGAALEALENAGGVAGIVQKGIPRNDLVRRERK